MTKDDCPNCGRYFRWLERLRFSGLIRWRRVLPCPRCGTRVRRSRVVYLANVSILAALVVKILGHAYLGAFMWPDVVSLGLLLVGVVASLMMKFENAT